MQWAQLHGVASEGLTDEVLALLVVDVSCVVDALKEGTAWLGVLGGRFLIGAGAVLVAVGWDVEPDGLVRAHMVVGLAERIEVGLPLFEAFGLAFVLCVFVDATVEALYLSLGLGVPGAAMVEL